MIWSLRKKTKQPYKFGYEGGPARIPHCPSGWVIPVMANLM